MMFCLPRPSRRVRAYATLVAAALGPLACAEPSSSRSRPDAARAPQTAGAAAGATRASLVPVDSALPADQLLRRFRERLGPPPVALAGGAPSRDSLVRLVVGAVARRDTTALAAAEISAAEFAYFYYPGNPQARPPYELPPQIMWLTMKARSGRGLGRLLREYGGTPLQLKRYRCDRLQRVQDGTGGAERIWAGCTVTYRRLNGSTATQPFFAAILERSGQYKILSYANEL